MDKFSADDQSIDNEQLEMVMKMTFKYMMNKNTTSTHYKLTVNRYGYSNNKDDDDMDKTVPLDELYEIKTVQEREEIWKGLRAMMAIMTNDSLMTVLTSLEDDNGISMLDILKVQLDTSANNNSNNNKKTSIMDMMKTVSYLWIRLQENVWGKQVLENTTAETFYKIIKEFCEHDGFRTTSRFAHTSAKQVLAKDRSAYPQDRLIRRIRSLVDWVFPFWYSLRMINDIEELTNHVLDTLLGYFQLNIWSSSFKTCAVSGAFQVIENCINDNKIPIEKINEYASKWVPYALMNEDNNSNLPETLNHIPSVAQSVLTHLLNNDTQTLRDSFITLASSLANGSADDDEDDDDGSGGSDKKKEITNQQLQSINISNYHKVWKELQSKSSKELAPIAATLLSSYAPLVNLNGSFESTNEISNLLEKLMVQSTLIHKITSSCLEYVSTLPWKIRMPIVYDPLNAQPIVALLVSSDPAIYISTYKLLTMNNTEINNDHSNSNFLDPKHMQHFFDNEPTTTLRALASAFKNYVELANAKVETYRMVLPYAKITSCFLQLLIGDEDSYLFQILISTTNYADDSEQNQRVIKSIWDNVWKVINNIFICSLQWSSQYKPKEILEKVLPWMDISNRIIGCRATFQKVVSHDTLDVSALLSAVDGLSSWIYVSRTSVLAKLVPLLNNILKYLQQLHIKISLDAYDRLYTAATGINPTRLEQHEKESLFICLSAHEPNNVVILDSDDDDSDDDIQWQDVSMDDIIIKTKNTSVSGHTGTALTLKTPNRKPAAPSTSTSPSPTLSSSTITTTVTTTKLPSLSISPTKASTPISNNYNNNNNNKQKQISISDSFKNTPPLSGGDTDKKTYYSCRPNTKITTYFGNTVNLQSNSDMDTVMKDTNDINKIKDTHTIEKRIVKSNIPTPLNNIEFSTKTTLDSENMDIDSNEVLNSSNKTPIINNIDHAAAISSLANKPSSRVFPTVPTSATYAVTSTGRKLRAPSMGYSKIQQLRKESKAERRLGATVKSPSAAAIHRKKKKLGSDDDDDDDDDDSNDDTDDDDDDDDETSGLMGLVESMNEQSGKYTQHQQHGNVVIQEPTSLQSLFDTNQPRRSIKLIEIPGQSKKIFERQKEARKQERQRKQKVTPNISNLYKSILAWSLENTSSATPPNTTNDMFNHIKDTYEGGFRDYVKYFEPLLLLEMWHQLIRAKESISTRDVMHRFILETRCHVNDFVDVNFLVPINTDIGMLSQDDLLCIANHFGPDFFTTTTMIRGAAAAATADSEGIGWRKMAFLGKVMSVSQRKNKGDVTVRCYFPPDRITILNSLSPKSQWQVVKLTSLSTVQREYAALYGLEHFDLVNDILNPRPVPMPTLSQEAVQKCIQTYNVNQPQAEAIVGALQKKKGFTLIQGPPGTGKTKTILGMIVTLLDQQKSLAKKNQSFPGKLLVCAPSNAAVDEIAKRLKEGVMTSDGLVKPKTIRIGVAESVNASVKDLILERQVEKELEPSNGQDADKNKTFTARKDKVRESLRKINLDIEQVDRELNRTIDSMVITRLYEKRRSLVQQRNRQNTIIKEIEEDYRDYSRDLDSSKLRVRKKIIGECDVVCATLSGSGHSILSDMGLVFDTVIVDEAAQAVEVSSLIPLKYDCKRCILVGDPNQLPPTVISLLAAKYSYQQSLFVRLEKNTPNNVYLLSIQYRMHPEISSFPSKLFYQSRLKDGPDMAEKTTAVWHSNTYLPPYAFFNIKHGQERQGNGASLYNVAEAEAAVALVDMLASNFPGLKLGYKIGIITPYKQQVSQLKFRFERRFGSKILQMIDFNTVDGFQGQEKDIIIFSCVRASNKINYGSIGFLSDIRRMNVGLTRAKKSLFVLGNARSLTQDRYWGDLVEDARLRNLLVNCEEPYFNYRMKYDFIPPNLFESEVIIQKTPIKERKTINPIIVPYENEEIKEDEDHSMPMATTTTAKKHLRYDSKEEELEDEKNQREFSRRKIDNESSMNKMLKQNSNQVNGEKPSHNTTTNSPTPSSTISHSKKAVPIIPPSNSNNNVNTASSTNHVPITKKPTLEEYNRIRSASKPKASSLFIPSRRNQTKTTSSNVNRQSSSGNISAKDRVSIKHKKIN
ncbi:unnamed protein product [Cunninghamella echinulata]